MKRLFFRNGLRHSINNKTALYVCAVITAIVISGSVIAQVSDRINLRLGEVYSPSGLAEPPRDLKKIPQPMTNKQPQDIPDEITYRQIFRHIEELNRKAADEESKGRDGTEFRNLYKTMARLDERQARILDGIAAKTNNETKQLDARAKQIISEVRAQTPDRKVPRGQPLPAPPAELVELNNRRRDVILQAVKELRANFGEVEFARFSRFVDEKVKTGIRKIDNQRVVSNEVQK